MVDKTRGPRPVGLPNTVRVTDNSGIVETSQGKPTTGHSGVDTLTTKDAAEQKTSTPVQAADPSAGLFALRSSQPFSKAPGTLGPMLHDEVGRAVDFVQGILEGLTFFGGARVKEDDAVFEHGKVWGEALFLANVTAADATIGAKAVASGLFSDEAVNAAKASALGVAAGMYGPAQLNQALIAGGGASSPEAVAGALAKLQSSQVEPAEAKLLMAMGARPRTGAGPGMMHAVPLGYISAKEKLLSILPEPDAQQVEKFLAQGSRMGGNLPFEQKASDAIDEMGIFKHFISRRMALTEGSAGFVVFPGGIGTLNELFEVMREGRPVLFDDIDFWKPITDAMTEQWRARGLVAEDEIDCFQIEDGIDKGLPYLIEASKSDPLDKATIQERGAEVGVELERTLGVLSQMDPAITFLGGRKLKNTDKEVLQAQTIASEVTKRGIPARIGGDGAVLNAVSRGVRKADADAKVQAVLHDSGDLNIDDAQAKAHVCEIVHTPIVHKLAMYENTGGIVALPGGKGTFDEVWEVACLMSTGNLPQRPLVLVGKDFWGPFIDACEQQMDNDNLRLVGEGYFRKFLQVVDTAEEAMEIIDAHLEATKAAGQDDATQAAGDKK